MFAAWASVSQHGNNERGILKIQAFWCRVIAAPGPGFVFRPECGSGVFGDRGASLSDVGFAEIRSALFLWAIGTKQKSAERNKSAHTGNKELLSKRQSTTACKHSSFSLTAFTGHAPKTSTGNETFVRCLASLAPVCVCGVCFSLREPVHRTLIYS